VLHQRFKIVLIVGARSLSAVSIIDSKFSFPVSTPQFT
jgi:hypothetical protein